MKKLLLELFPLKIEKTQLVESMSKNNGRMIIPNMKIQQAEKPNRNSRIYSRSILERETSNLMNGVRQAGSRGIMGELDHTNESVVNLKNVCLGILDYRWKGNDQLGDVEIINTPAGNILKEIILAGYVPGISSRGMGSVESVHGGDDPDVVEVQEDFQLLCWDAVSDPSSQNAYFKEIREGKLNESYTPPTQSNIHILLQEIICDLSGVCCIKPF